MRVRKEEFPIFLPKLTYQSPRPGVAESQITSPADQSKPLAEERASLAYLRQPTRSLRTQTSTPLGWPIRTTSRECRQQRQPMPSAAGLTPLQLSLSPTWCAGGVYGRGREGGEAPPPAAGGYRPTRGRPPAGRPCPHRLPLRARPTAAPVASPGRGEPAARPAGAASPDAPRSPAPRPAVRTSEPAD